MSLARADCSRTAIPVAVSSGLFSIAKNRLGLLDELALRMLLTNAMFKAMLSLCAS